MKQYFILKSCTFFIQQKNNKEISTVQIYKASFEKRNNTFVILSVVNNLKNMQIFLSKGDSPHHSHIITDCLPYNAFALKYKKN